MKYSTVYVGMDVHKESFSLCCYTNEKEQAEYPQKVDGHYSKVINYIEAMRFHYKASLSRDFRLSIFPPHGVGRDNPLFAKFADIDAVDKFSISDSFPKGTFVKAPELCGIAESD